MENIIAEHFNEIKDFRTLALIFDIEPIFIKSIQKVSFFPETTLL